MLNRVAAPSALAAAWADVLLADARDEVLSTGVQRFGKGVEGRLAELSAQLLDGSYEPGVLTEVVTTDADGGERVLRVRACGTGSWSGRSSAC
ncbi:hypothetical protein ACIA5G_47965 [Amycolatopsis sp. NPDC051758]|uniref:hypothetical protein n=1 Tax=Amycolatopsis sp. NPDC051758 TaxID=3363935 RepID=UPI0037B44D4C